MSIPETESLLSFSTLTGCASSAVSAVTSTGKACVHAAISGLTALAGGVSATLKKGIAFTATVHNAHPKISKAGLAAIGLVGAAYALHRSYPAIKKMLSK